MLAGMRRLARLIVAVTLLIGACESSGNPNAPSFSSCGAWHGVNLVDSLGVAVSDTTICVEPQ